MLSRKFFDGFFLEYRIFVEAVPELLNNGTPIAVLSYYGVVLVGTRAAHVHKRPGDLPLAFVVVPVQDLGLAHFFCLELVFLCTRAETRDARACR